MKKLWAYIGIVSWLGSAFAVSVLAQQQDATSQRTTMAPPTSQSNPSAETVSTLQGVLLSSDTLIGASVKNQHGDSVGSIERLLINPQTGLVSYAVLGVGGLFGVGEKSIIVPWRAIEIARNGDSLVIQTTKQLLHQAPEATPTPNKDPKG